MAATSWRSRLRAWVGGFGVPGGFDATSGQRRLKGFVNVAQILRRGITYWIGIRHSSTAILSAWASTATPDLNGGTPVTTARKVLRRTLAYATAAPGTWGYLASETNAGPASAIWLRAA